jgi:two-component system, OmpR family, response regulator VanR
MIKILNDKKLLLLEDSDEFIENIVSLFNMFVKETLVAKDIRDAKRLYNENSIDMIVSDINLKQENGLDFIKSIREINSEIPIVVLSGHKDEEYLFRAMTLNLSGYLLKPVNFKSLVDVFEDCAKRIALNLTDTINLKEGFIYNKELKRVCKDDEIFTLNKKEILFFDMLILNKTKVITKEMIASFVYEDENMSDSALNNFIMRLRRRFGKTFLHTIPDVGYKLIV